MQENIYYGILLAGVQAHATANLQKGITKLPETNYQKLVKFQISCKNNDFFFSAKFILRFYAN
jgi:hypothetical protein